MHVRKSVKLNALHCIRGYFSILNNAFMFIHTYVRTYIHTCIHTYIAYMHRYIYVHIRTYTYTWVHTYVHTYIATYLVSYVTSICIYSYYVHFSIVNCSFIIAPNNGVINCSLGDDGVTSYEDTCNFTCNTGYELIGSDTRTCQSDRSWSGSNATCNRGM